MALVVHQKASGKKKKGGKELPPTALSYSGPTRPLVSSGNLGTDVVTFPIINIATLSSSGTGTLATVFDSQSQMAAGSDWTAYSNLYAEFRLLSMDIEFLPYNYVNTTSGIVRTAVFSVEDRQTATALASDADVTGYATTLTAHTPATHFRKVMRMSGPGEALWVSTGSSPAAADRLYIKLWSSGNTNSLLLYSYVNIMMVQFRQRR